MTKFCHQFVFVLAAAMLFCAGLGCERGRHNQGEAQQSKGSGKNGEPRRLADGTIQLVSGEVESPDGASSAESNQFAGDPFHASMHALRPLQVFIGKWQGITVRAIGGAKAIENPEWNWDFLSDSQQPALVLTSKSSPYIRLGKLTFRTDRRVFQLTVTSAKGSQRVYEGTFSQPPRDVADASGSRQRSFKLKLAEVPATPDSESFVICQERNDRYVVEVYRPKNGGLEIYDKVETVREGPGVAIDPAQSPDRLCVVSGGIGSETVEYDGKKYRVCCEGCKAAFQADPRRWLAEFDLRQSR